MNEKPEENDSGMAQLDVFFSLFGIILVVMAIINLSVQQRNEPPNFSHYRPVDTKTYNTRIPVLGYITSAYVVWYVTENQIFRLKREIIASQMLRVAGGQTILLQNTEYRPADILRLDSTDPSGFFLQLSAQNIETSKLFEPIAPEAQNGSDLRKAIVQRLRDLTGKPLALQWQRNAAKIVLMIETEGLGMGISVHKARSNDRHIQLFRNPSSFYSHSRAR